MAHKHFKEMMMYAEDAAETDTPWVKWKFKSPRSGWSDLCNNPAWHLLYEYRRKPKLFQVRAEFSIPIPYRGDINSEESYYTISFTNTDLCQEVYDSLAEDLKEQGLLHLTQENAKEHALQLIALTEEA